MTGKRTRRDDGAARPSGAHSAPAEPRRPSPGGGSKSDRAPGKGDNRPSPSLVNRRESSTLPDLRLSLDDIGRAFLSRPVFGNSVSPSPTYGARVTSCLTRHAARQIKGAAIKAHNLGLDLQTFITFTLADASRDEIAGGGLVLGHEMRRTLNAVQERFRRQEYGDFAYEWVAENPGQGNPHVHMLTNHRVPRPEFRDFAGWLEGLWGHGWAKVERIRKPQSAGNYLLKAVGYSAKGTTGGQGTIYGNRFGISRNIRPKRDCFDIYDEAEAAEGLLELTGSMEPGVEIEPIGRLWLTPYGLAFRAGTTVAQIEATINALKTGVVP